MTEPLEPGRVLGGRYRLGRELARGGMGTVWQADDPLLSRQIAVKTLDPLLAVDEALRARFRREAIAAAAVTHPNIVATYDTGEDDGVAYIVMELVDGVTLRELIDERGTLPVARAADIAFQVADALSVAHARGLVHRDVKPGNVLVQPDGRVKVTDFGIAKAADSGGEALTRSGMVVGTARYLAPEQVEGRAVDERVDVYSLGLVLYEMLCGKPPFEADTDIATAVARLTAPPRPISIDRPGLPPGLVDVLDRSLARDPEERWPSAAAFRDALGPFRDAVDSIPVDPTIPVRLPPRPPARPGRRPPPSSPAATPGGSSLARVVVWFVAFAVGASAGYWIYRELDHETASHATPVAPVAAPIPVVGARDYDPQGDQHENAAQVGAIVDGNGATVWVTETYFERNMRPKQGVGFWLDLGKVHRVERVEVDSPDSGWSAQVYASDTVPPTLAGWGPPVAQAQDLGSRATLTFDPARRAQYVLLWITNLPATSPFRLRIAEARVVGTS